MVVAIDGKAVGDDGTVELRRSELLHADFLITCKPPGARASPLSARLNGERLTAGNPILSVARRLLSGASLVLSSAGLISSVGRGSS